MIRGTAISRGHVLAPTVRLAEPISFWGGVSETGVVIDPHHPQHGAALAGKVLLVSSGRGSSSSSSVLAELIRSGAAPSAIVLAQPDAIIVLGAIVAAELYNIPVPIIVVQPNDHMLIPDRVVVSITAGDDTGIIAWV
jgi:predicted aconitase with swiveling domain